MPQKLLINVSVEETRVALVESGRLENLEIDSRQLEEAKGNIYKARVHRVNASLQAAFVDYGTEKQGFLPLAEIHDRYYPNGQRDKKLSITDVLRNGQELMVQVVKDEIGNKGASLSTFVSLPGRYLVLMAQTDKTGISRRLPGDERSRLKRIIDNLDLPDGFGVIIRTAGVGRDEDELKADLDYLKRLWGALEQRFKDLKRPDVVHQERSIAMRFLRDYATNSLEEIIVDDIEVTEEIRDFCTILVPELRKKVTFYEDPTPLFSRYQVEDQIDDVFARRIDLPSGGYIIIDQTEAMVSVDVNSGRVKTDDIEKTALTTNLESASEVARQLKIRDLGGLVVVDFIDMRERANIKRVEQEAKEAFANDKAKVKFTRISDFGLMEISRQRLKATITKGSFSQCNHCGGTGMLRSVESSALYLLRRLKETVIRGNYLHAVGRAPVEIANYLANRKRRELMDLEYQTKTTIEIRGLMKCPPTMAFVELLTRPQRGKRPKRYIQEYDLVRSDVKKEELTNDDDFLVEAAHARGVSLSDDDWKELYRRIEKQLATEADKRLQRKEKEAKEAERRAQEAERRAQEAVEEVARAEEALAEIQKKPGLMGWFKRLMTGGGSPQPSHEPTAPVQLEDKRHDERHREDRPHRSKPAAERIRSRNHGPRSRPLKAKEAGDDPKNTEEQNTGEQRQRRRKRRRGGGGGGGGGGRGGGGRAESASVSPSTSAGENEEAPRKRKRRRRKRNDGRGLGKPNESESAAAENQGSARPKDGEARTKDADSSRDAKAGSERSKDSSEKAPSDEKKRNDNPKSMPKKQAPAKAAGKTEAAKPTVAEGNKKVGNEPQKVETALASKPTQKKASKPLSKDASSAPKASETKPKATTSTKKPAPAANKAARAPSARPTAPRRPSARPAARTPSRAPKPTTDTPPKAPQQTSSSAAASDEGSRPIPRKGGVVDLRGSGPGQE